MKTQKSKGVTPIVSVVLLLLMTIALAGGVMVYLTGYTSGLQNDVVVKDAVCTRTNATHVQFRVRILNAGGAEIRNLDVTQLSGPSSLSSNGIGPLSSESVLAGQQKVITFNGNHSTFAVGTYVFDIASDTGFARATFSCP